MAKQQGNRKESFWPCSITCKICCYFGPQVVCCRLEESTQSVMVSGRILKDSETCLFNDVSQSKVVPSSDFCLYSWITWLNFFFIIFILFQQHSYSPFSFWGLYTRVKQVSLWLFIFLKCISNRFFFSFKRTCIHRDACWLQQEGDTSRVPLKQHHWSNCLEWTAHSNRLCCSTFLFLMSFALFLLLSTFCLIWIYIFFERK